ncbi:MAG: PIN domain-containing protein [Acidobacteriaceae bacterium]
MRSKAVELVNRLPRGSVVLPVQTLGELFQVLVRKAGRSPEDARSAILTWRDAFASTETSASTVLPAADLVASHQFGFWDAVILAAAEAGCRLLLSADMQNGSVWQGITIANPFLLPRHALLEAMLSGAHP